MSTQHTPEQAAALAAHVAAIDAVRGNPSKQAFDAAIAAGRAWLAVAPKVKEGAS